MRLLTHWPRNKLVIDAPQNNANVPKKDTTFVSSFESGLCTSKELGYTGEAQEVTVPISSIVHSLEDGAPSELL